MNNKIIEYGGQLFGRDWRFRGEVAGMMRSRDSGISKEFSTRFMKLKEADSDHLNDAFTKTESSLRLSREIDPFITFSALDKETGQASADNE
jgi:hypothetical protein